VPLIERMCRAADHERPLQDLPEQPQAPAVMQRRNSVIRGWAASTRLNATTISAWWSPHGTSMTFKRSTRW